MAAFVSKFLDKRVLVVMLLLFAGIALLLNIRNRQDLQRRADLPNRNVNMQIGSSVTSAELGQEFLVDVGVAYNGSSTNNRKVYGVDLKISFDKERLRVINDSTAITRGSTLADGCSTSPVAGLPVVLAPVNSETDCNFKDIELGGVIEKANNTGVLEFGAAPFSWASAEIVGYKPTPILLSYGSPALQVAKIKFRVKATAPAGNAFIKVDAVDDSAGLPVTTDTNVAGLSGTNTVGDVLLLPVNPNGGLNVNVVVPSPTPTITGAPTATPTPAGNCDSRVAAIDTSFPGGVAGAKDGNIDLFEVTLYINNYNCSVGSGCDSRIPNTADGALGSPNGTIDLGEVTLAINNYQCRQ